MNIIEDIEVYVRFCETDMIGHVNNVSYFYYLEEGRSKFFDSVYPRDMTNNKLNFVIVSVKCDYIDQAYASDTLRIKTSIKSIGNKSITFEQKVFKKETSILLMQSTCVCVCYDNETKKTVLIPPKLREVLNKNKSDNQ